MNDKREELPEDLKDKLSNLMYLRITAGIAGNIGGLIFAYNKGYKFWGKVGMFILGGFALGVIATIATMSAKQKIITEAMERGKETGN